MTIHVEGRTYCKVEIEGVPLEIPGLVGEVIIIEHINNVVPTAKILFTDTIGVLSKNLALQDGTKVSLQMGADETAPRQKFSIFSATLGSNADREIRTSHLILDAPEYYAKSVRVGINGSSSSAIRKIASDAGLTFDGDSTNDSQVWLGLGVTASNYVRMTADCGYGGDTSFMDVAVTADGKLLYVDVNRKIMGGANLQVGAAGSSDGDIFADEVKFYASSAFRNIWINYGQYNFFHDVEGEFLENKIIRARKPDGYMAINSSVKSGIEYAKIDTFDYDCGNVHRNYQKAKYQNLRMRLGYTQFCSLLFRDRESKLDLFDVVNVDFWDVVEGDAEKHEKSGKYIVMAKSRVIRGGARYGERVELMRPNVRERGATSLVG